MKLKWLEVTKETKETKSRPKRLEETNLRKIFLMILGADLI